MRQYQKLVVLVGIIVFANGSAADAGPILWNVNGHYYDLILPSDVSGSYTWFEANNAAQALTFMGSTGHLVTVTSAEEDNFLRSNFAFLIAPDVIVNGKTIWGDYAWIGLSDARSEGVYEWVTGEPFSYTNWAREAPNNFPWIPQGEDYIHYWTRDNVWSWNDLPPGSGSPDWGRNRIGFFVEFESPVEIAAVPEPPTLILILLAGFSLSICIVYRKVKRSLYNSSQMISSV